MIQGGSAGGRLGGTGIGMKGGTTGATGVNGMTSIGRNEGG